MIAKDVELEGLWAATALRPRSPSITQVSRRKKCVADVFAWSSGGDGVETQVSFDNAGQSQEKMRCRRVRLVFHTPHGPGGIRHAGRLGETDVPPIRVRNRYPDSK